MAMKGQPSGKGNVFSLLAQGLIPRQVKSHYKVTTGTPYHSSR